MIYLHVPFCESRCTYCGFFSVVPSSAILGDSGGDSSHRLPVASRPYPGKWSAVGNVASCDEGASRLKVSCFEAYADAVCEEIERRRDEIAKALSVNTLYIGGGTPSVLPLDILSRIVSSIDSLQGRGAPAEPVAARGHMNGWLAAGETGRSAKRGGFGGAAPSGSAILGRQWEEFTFEMNPEDIVEKGEEYVRGLVELGVNRISMGIQSFNDDILRWMNRRHDSAGAEEAFRILRRCGVCNISIDLIFGLSQLTESIWADTVEKALALAPEHISAYQLSVEEGSALERMISRGIFTEAADEQCRWQYDYLCSRLSEAGYRHYEISNFALPGREAIHNSAYWRRVPYVGLGPGAHSLSAGSVRSWNSRDLPRRLQDGSLTSYSREEEHLTLEDIRVERIMLPLRTDMGLPESELRSLAGDESVDRLLASGALIRCHPERVPEPVEGRSGFLRIPEDHFFISDDIIRELI